MVHRTWRRMLCAGIVTVLVAGSALQACGGDDRPPPDQGTGPLPDTGTDHTSGGHDASSGSSSGSSVDATSGDVTGGDGSAEGGGAPIDVLNDYVFDFVAPPEDAPGHPDGGFHPPPDATLPDGPETIGDGGGD